MTSTPSTAAEYADHIQARIEAEASTEAPFGFVNTYDDSTADTLDELLSLIDPDDVPDGQLDADHLPGDWQKATGYDYLRNVLDIRYIIGSDRRYRDAEICVGLGGPNVWIHTATREVVVHWGFESARRPLPASYVDALDQAAEELWEMGA